MRALNPIRLVALFLISLFVLPACTTDDLGETQQAIGEMISTDQTTYQIGQSITVTWSGMPGNAMDWVAITTAGSPPDSGFVGYTFINGQTSGSYVFGSLPVGSYEARAYVNNTYTVVATASFTVSNLTTTRSVSTDQSTYTIGQDVTVNWTNMPGNMFDWVAINQAGSPPDGGFVAYAYINGATSGSHVFSNLPIGNYEARMYLNNTYTVLASASFSVGMITTNPMISTDQTTYMSGQPVTVTWSGLPGNMNDFIAINTGGSAPDSGFVQFYFTNGVVSGSHIFTGIADGSYEARAYLNNSYTILASSSFSVNVGCSAGTLPAIGSISSGDLVMDSTSAQATAALAVDLSTSVLFTSVAESEPSPQYGAVMCSLHDVDTTQMLPAGVTCDRTFAGTDTGNGTVTVHYTVVTFTSGVTVQRGVANTGFTNPLSVPLTTIDPAQSFVLLNGIYVNGSGWGNNEFVRSQILDGSTLELRTNSPGTQVSWQVVTMAGASVQRGGASFASGDTTMSPSIATAPSGSLVLTSYTTDNASGIAASAMMLRANLNGSTSITLARDGTGAALDVSWEVVSLPFATSSGIASFAAGETTKTSSVSGIAAGSSVGIAAGQAILGQSGGSTTYAGADLDLVGEATATVVTGSGAVTITRTSNQAAATIPWTVIDFAHNCNGM